MFQYERAPAAAGARSSFDRNADGGSVKRLTLAGGAIIADIEDR
jgi:hypothetical protein